MSGYTGRLFEEEAFGRCLLRGGADGYRRYREALEEVRANQPWDPSDPRPRFANDLHAEVALALALAEWAELRFYTAVGSALDRWHGVDGFFEFGDARVTLDVTCNSAKLDGYKADFIVSQVVVEEPSARQELARAIARELERQLAAASAQPQGSWSLRRLRRAPR